MFIMCDCETPYHDLRCKKCLTVDIKWNVLSDSSAKSCYTLSFGHVRRDIIEILFKAGHNTLTHSLDVQSCWYTVSDIHLLLYDMNWREEM